MNALDRIFGAPKPVIAMLHLPALPGRPLHDRSAGTAAAVESVARDLDALQSAGVDGVLFCNEADLPYQLRVGPEITAAMAAVIGQVRGELRVPFGVNLLWDAMASLAVARASGASFIREVLTGVYESDLGMIEPNVGEIAAYRTAIGGEDIALFDNIAPEFASAIGSRGIAERARGAAYLRHGRRPDLRAGGRGLVRDERPAAGQGGGARPAGHRQYRRACRPYRRDFQPGRRRDRGDQPEG